MGVNFTENQWDVLTQNNKKWWKGELGRPIMPLLIGGRDPGRPEPKAPPQWQHNCTDFSFTAEEIIDRADYELSKFDFAYDGFPVISMDYFGPGVAAAFLGAKLDNSSGMVWFFPEKELPISEIHLEYDPDNKWLRHVKSLYVEGMKRWGGQVLMTMPDLGGLMDVVATFVGSQNLLYALYDEPEEVKRLGKEVRVLWHKLYDEFDEIIRPYTKGYSDWSRTLYPGPAYIHQSDFSYMIGKDMFDEFVLPDLTESMRIQPNSLYHLDGVGQLPHLDSILKIPDIAGVQWVPGDGTPSQENWPEVYVKIAKAGKKIQGWCGAPFLDVVKNATGTIDNVIHAPFYCDNENEKEIRKMIESYF